MAPDEGARVDGARFPDRRRSVAGDQRLGKRLSLLPLIRRFEGDVEADFARFYPAIDYRDRYRRGGGTSYLTVRRLLVLVEKLPAESAFQAAREDRAPVSLAASAIMDVWESLAGKRHPGRASMSDRRRQAEERVERARLIARRRREAREHNARFLARRKRK